MRIHGGYIFASMYLFTVCDAVIDFNQALINSRLKSDYLLFEERPANEYNHLGIAIDNQNGVRYAETFIHADSNYYIKGQKISKIKKFVLYDKKNNVIVEDRF